MPARQTDSAPTRSAIAIRRLNRSARDVEAYNLERQPLVFAVFGRLAEAAPG